MTTRHNFYGQYHSIVWWESNRLTALKTISMRLRSSSSDLEKAGEDTEGAAESVSTLRKELLALSGVDIMLDDSTYRSTYDIIVDLSKVWNQLTDIQQASITALVSGVRQGNVFSSMLSNMQTGIKATETALNSSGSAMKENEKQISSIRGRISQFTAAFEELSAKTLNSDWLKTIIQMGTSVLNLVNDMGGLLPILVAIGGAITAFKLPAIILSVTKFVGLIQAFPAALSMASAALGANATAAKTLNMALGALNVTATSTQLAVGAITAVLTAGLMIWGAVASAQEKNAQKAKEAQQAIISESESVEDLIKQYKDLTKAGDWDNETRDIAKDIQEKLTDLVGDEAKNLDLVNGKLDEQITKLKAIEVQTLKNKENALIAAANTAQQGYDNQKGSSSWWFGLSGYQYSKSGILSDSDSKAFDLINDQVKELSTSVSLLGSFVTFTNDAFTDTPTKIKILGNTLDLLKSVGLDNSEVFTQLQASLRGYEDSISNVDKANKDLNENSAKILIATKMQTEEMPKTVDEYKKFKEELLSSATAVDKTTGGYTNSFRGTSKEVTAAVETILTSIKEFYDFVQNNNDATNATNAIFTFKQAIENSTDKLVDINNQTSLLASAYKEISENGSLSADTIEKIIGLEGDYVNLLYVENGQVKLNYDEFIRLSKQSIQAEINKLNVKRSTLSVTSQEYEEISKLIGVYQVYISNLGNSVIAEEDQIKTLDDTIDQLKSLESIYEDVNEQKEISTFDLLDLIDNYPDLITAIKRTETGYILEANAIKEVIKQRAENLRLMAEEERKKVAQSYIDNSGGFSEATAKNFYDKVQSGEITADNASLYTVANGYVNGLYEYIISLLKEKNIGQVATDIINDSFIATSSSVSNSSEDVWLEAFNKQYDDIQYLRDKDVISAQEYFKRLKEINDYYFKGRNKYLDEYRKYDVEYYQGMKALREQDIADYLSSVEELYKVHQNETQYINDLQWAFTNWSNMSDEQRKTISDKIFEAQSARSENIISDIEHQIQILESRSASEEELIALYQKIQDELHSAAERYRSLGYGEDSTEIQNLQSQYLSYQAKKDEANETVHRRATSRIQSEIELLEEQGGKEEELIEKYKSLYVESYDQIQRLKGQGLTDEDELVKEYLSIWRDAYKTLKELQTDLTEDRISDIEHQIFLLGKATEYSGEKNTSGKPNAEIIAQYEQLMQIAKEEMDKLFAQGFTENDTEVQEWQKRWYSYYDAITAAGEDAFSEMQSAEKETLDKMTDDVQDKIDDLNTIIDKTVDLIKHEKEAIIESLENQKKGYKDIIDKRKELLQTYHDEVNYQDELSDKQKDISTLESRLLTLQLDNSDKAKAERLKLEEEIAEKKKDLSKYQADNALENQLDALDKEYEAYESNLDSQIDAIRRYLEEEGTLRADAMRRIQADGEALYAQLLDYNRQYGTGVDQDISNAWTNAQSAMETYGGAQQDVLSTLQQMTAALDDYAAKAKSLESSTYTPPNYSLPENQVTATPDSIINQMKANSQAWTATTDPAERQALHDSNVRLAENYSKMFGEQLYYNAAEGSWYLGDKKIKLYHEGGIVGGKPLLKSNEEFAKLLKGEVPATPTQMDNFMKKTLPTMLNWSAIKPSASKFENSFEFNFNGDVNKDTLPDLQKMLSNIPNMVTKALTEQLSSRGIKTSALIKSF